VESIDQVWVFVAIALAAGVALGAILHKMLSSSAGDADRLRAELERTRSEMERYKASVNSHFSKTSDLVSELTQDYVKVYQHLAEGAQTLSDSPEFTQMLEHSEGKVLISVEDGIRAAEPVVVEPLSEATEPLPEATEPLAEATEPLAAATEPPPVDDVRPQGGDVEAAQPGDRESPVAADDESIAAAAERKDPVIAQPEQDAEIDPLISPAAQKIDTAQQDSESDSAKRTSAG